MRENQTVLTIARLCTCSSITDKPSYFAFCALEPRSSTSGITFVTLFHIGSTSTYWEYCITNSTNHLLVISSRIGSNISYLSKATCSISVIASPLRVSSSLCVGLSSFSKTFTSCITFSPISNSIKCSNGCWDTVFVDIISMCKKNITCVARNTFVCIRAFITSLSSMTSNCLAS